MAAQEIKKSWWKIDVGWIWCDEVNNTVVSLSCNECSCVEIESIGDKAMKDFRNVVGRDQPNDGVMELIDKFDIY